MPFFETEDCARIYYEVHGQGDPIILIHGLTANHSHFKYQIDGLKDRFQIIVYDLRGHGNSEVTDQNLNIGRLALDFKALMTHLNLSKVSVVGWSLGTFVVFAYIQKFGCANLKDICIIDMTPKVMKSDGTDKEDAWRYGLSGLSGRPGDFGPQDNTQTMSAMANGDWKTISRKLVERQYDKALTIAGKFDHTADFKGKEDFDWLYEQAVRNKSYVIVTMWAAMSMLDYRDLLETIDIPVMITYGEGSNYYPRENSEFMGVKIRRSQVVGFSGCGHALHIQDPEKFNGLLAEFVSANSL